MGAISLSGVWVKGAVGSCESNKTLLLMSFYSHGVAGQQGCFWENFDLLTTVPNRMLLLLYAKNSEAPKQKFTYINLEFRLPPEKRKSTSGSPNLLRL
jgi:hypothetical protein